jgi:tRNA-splicing endonuclease subunit Sen34
MEGKVPLHVSNGVAYVWSVDGERSCSARWNVSLIIDDACDIDIETLRVTHRICGTLSGTLPSVSQQNVFLGVPLTLLPEEVATLVNTGTPSLHHPSTSHRCRNTGVACIVHDAHSHGKPTKQQLRDWAEVRKAVIQAELQERMATSRAAAVRVDMSDKAQQKRLEREARKAARQQQQPQAVLIPEPEAAAPTPTPTALSTHTVHVPGPSSELPWYTAQIFHTLDEARSAGIWEYPRDVKERAECAVFRDLWEKGNYLGPGIKFGGNYLVYPGTFLLALFHCARLLDEIEQAIHSGSILTLSPLFTRPRRLSSGLWTLSHSAASAQRRKRCIFCAGTTMTRGLYLTTRLNGPALAK